jgi:hypothetical protein
MFVRRGNRFLSICLFGLSSARWTVSTSSFRIVVVADTMIPSMDTLLVSTVIPACRHRSY